MFRDKQKEEAEEAMREMSDSFSAVRSEVEITPEVQSKYIAYHDKVDVNAYSEEYVMKESEKLSKENTPENDKKRIIFLLGHIATLSGVRIIEEFLKKAEGELKQWAVLAFEEGWMFLESEIMGTNNGRIFSGAGGNGDRMRYYFSIRSKNKKPFDDSQKKLIQEKIEKTSSELNSKVEIIEFKDDILLVSALVPMDVALGEVIEKSIKACNAENKILNSYYFATNQKKPDWDEVEKNTLE